MYNHPTAEQLRQYSERTLPPDAFAMIDRHVASCAVCYEKCGASRGSQQDYADLLSALLPASDDGPYHLSYEQLAAYVDSELDEADRLAVGSHLEVCAQCRDDVRSLQEFKAEGLVGPAPESLKEPVLSLRSSQPPRPAQRHRKRAAVVAAAIGLIILLALILLRPRPTDQAGLAQC